MTDWWGWRKCPTCLSWTGVPCVARSGRVVNGQPDGLVAVLIVPHRARKPRVRR